MAAPLTSAKTGAANTNASSPLLKLPTELRLQIYNFALQNTIVYLDRSSSDWMLRPRYYGSLALLHTSRLLQSECVREMLPVMRVELAKREAHVKYLTGQGCRDRELGYVMSRADREELWLDTDRADTMRCLVARITKMLLRWNRVLSQFEDARRGLVAR